MEYEPFQIGEIYQMKCGKVFDLSKIVAITDIHYLGMPGYVNCSGFEVYFQMTENPVIIHNGSWGGVDKVKPDREEILKKWIDYKSL